MIWARGGLSSTNCPKSLITARSLAWIEEFLTWKAFGGGVLWSMPAKTAEALLVLEQAWRKERENES